MDSVLELEISLARLAVPREARRSAAAMYHPTSLSSLPWPETVRALLAPLQLQDEERVVVASPEQLQQLSDLLAATPHTTTVRGDHEKNFQKSQFALGFHVSISLEYGIQMDLFVQFPSVCCCGGLRPLPFPTWTPERRRWRCSSRQRWRAGLAGRRAGATASRRWRVVCPLWWGLCMSSASSGARPRRRPRRWWTGSGPSSPPC